MAKNKLFISSVQGKFAAERKALHGYICANPLRETIKPLLGKSAKYET